jgi:hypothetical protein
MLHVQWGRLRHAERHPELRPALLVRVDGGQVFRPRRSHLLRHQRVSGELYLAHGTSISNLIFT